MKRKQTEQCFHCATVFTLYVGLKPLRQICLFIHIEHLNKNNSELIYTFSEEYVSNVFKSNVANKMLGFSVGFQVVAEVFWVFARLLLASQSEKASSDFKYE